MAALMQHFRRWFAGCNQKDMALLKRRIERELCQAGCSRKEAKRKAAEIVDSK